MISRLLLLVLVLVLDAYAYQGLLTIFKDSDFAMPVAVLYWSFSALFVLTVLFSGLVPRSRWPRSLMLYTPPVFISAFLGKLLLSVFLLLDDLVRLIRLASGVLEPERLPLFSYAGLLAGGIPFLLLLYGMWRNAYRYEFRQIPLVFRDLHPDLQGLRIVQLSDIHSGSLQRPDKVSEAVERINALSPDIILFTGDLVNMVASEAEAYIPIFSQLSAPLGIYSITGNHDYGDYVAWSRPEQKRDNFEHFKDIHRRLGWRLLMNEHLMLSVRKANLALIGVENWSAFGRFPKYGDLAAAHKGTERADLRLLLSHDPSHWKAQVLDLFPDIHAMFAGHTHGFQFGLEIGEWQWSPGQYFYREWAGLYEQQGRYLYVNRGFGYTFYPGRVGMRPEISVFELRSA